MLKDEFETTFRELTQLGYALVFIAHSKTKKTEFTDEEGNFLDAQAPDLTNAAYQICNRMVDIIGYIGVEYDKTGRSKRYLYTRATPTIFAGSRYKYLEPKIELSYQNLVDAIAAAMEKEAEMTGTTLIEGEVNLGGETKRPFADVMEEAKNIWQSYIGAVQTDEEKAERLKIMKEAIKHSFGTDSMKLSQATENQQDMVELFIDEMKEYL